MVFKADTPERSYLHFMKLKLILKAAEGHSQGCTTHPCYIWALYLGPLWFYLINMYCAWNHVPFAAQESASRRSQKGWKIQDKKNPPKAMLLP